MLDLSEVMLLEPEGVEPVNFFRKTQSLRRYKTHMVNQLTSNWNRILSEINQWYDFLGEIYLAQGIPARRGNDI